MGPIGNPAIGSTHREIARRLLADFALLWYFLAY